jgi:hypothetical protein
MPMEIAAAGSQQLAALRLVLAQRAEVLAGLEVGQAVAGTVVEAMRDGAVLLSVRGSLLPARAQRPIPSGTALALRVERTEPQVVLRLVDEAPAPAAVAGPLERASAALPAALADVFSDLAAPGDDIPAEVAHAVREARAALADLLPDAAKLSGESVRRGIAGSGLGYEGRLADLVQRGADGKALAGAAWRDLKGILLRLGTRLGAGLGRGRGTRLAAHVRTAVAGLEARQAVLATTLREGEVQVTLPLLLGEVATFAHLTIRRDPGPPPRGGGPGERGYAVLMLLDLDGLGSTRVEVRIQRGQVGGRILVRDPEASAFLAERAPALSERLAAAAGVAGHIGCAAAPEPEADPLFAPAGPPGTDALAPLDVKV